MDIIPPGTDLSKVPLGVNPNGDPPNFVDPPSLTVGVQSVGITLAVTTLIFLVLRLRNYTKLNHGLVLDDVFLLIAYGLALAYTIMASTLGRLSKHMWDVPMSEINEDYLKKLFATSIIYGPMFFFAKAAILLLYYRAFKPKIWMRWSIFIIMGLMFGTYWMAVPLNFIYCMPHHGRPWDVTVLTNCNHLRIPGLVHGGMNVAADVTLVCLPIPVVSKLQIPLGKKIAILGIFATGLLALVCSILAVYYRVMIINGEDSLWANAQAWIVIQAEIYAAICVACMPSLAKLGRFRFKESKLYTTLQSLLRSTGRTSNASQRTKRFQPSPNASVSALKHDPAEVSEADCSFSSIHGAEDGYELQRTDGAYRLITVDVTSQEASLEVRSKEQGIND
ncbi:hypothetical protein BDV96DRAFT_646803 [Lophiotrema nucula]|uniref:Rhodopsin domain-containing protein n=1 Tax=Lophiotrema nucula TaxID=690887 RepID=A0A6A5Z842_9PLEO|nr:hypothetical protein BDV96DRAFT_646803 [Lophiotrema nucula]